METSFVRVTAIPKCAFLSFALVAFGANAAEPINWDDAFSELEYAATLPPRQGVGILFKEFRHLRVEVAVKLTQSCPGSLCKAPWGDPRLQERIDAEIDELINDRITTKGSLTSFYHVFPVIGPFHSVSAFRSNNQAYALMVFEFRPSTAPLRSEFEQRYGPWQFEKIDENGDGYMTCEFTNGQFSRRIKLDLAQLGPPVKKVWLSVTRK